MPFLALITSACLHALWNALLKRERRPQVAVAGVLFFALLFAAVAAIVSGRLAFETSAALGWAFAAGIFEGSYLVTLAAALARADYGIVYTTARGGAMLLVWPFAAFLLHEPVTPFGAAGACLVAVGLALTTAHPVRRALSWGGMAFSAACAASVAGYHLCYDRALSAGAHPTPLFAVALATALPLVLLSLRGLIPARDIRFSPRSTLRFAFAGLLCTASFLLFLSGLAAAGAGVALTLRNTSIVFAQGLALVLGERPTRVQMAGAGLVAVGAALFGSSGSARPGVHVTVDPGGQASRAAGEALQVSAARFQQDEVMTTGGWRATSHPYCVGIPTSRRCRLRRPCANGAEFQRFLDGKLFAAHVGMCQPGLAVSAKFATRHGKGRDARVCMCFRWAAAQAATRAP